MAEYIFLLVGASGGGKSTVSRILQQDYGLKAVQSYTTRPPRYEGEEGHTFITVNDMIELAPHMVAYTVVGEYEYCATEKQISDNDLYVIDPDGVEWMPMCYRGNKTPVVLYYDVPRKIRKERMLKRGDSPKEVAFRLKHDRREFRKFARQAHRQLLPYLSFVIDNSSDDINLAVADTLSIIGSLTSENAEDMR